MPYPNYSRRAKSLSPLGQFIDMKLRERKETINSFAAANNINGSKFSRWCKGDGMFGVKELNLLSQHLGVPLATLAELAYRKETDAPNAPTATKASLE